MSTVSLAKITPNSVIAIGDDGKHPASNLFDQSLDTRWSYQGKFAYNLIKFSDVHILDRIMIFWYMKKNENRVYDFGIYLTEEDITIPADFEEAKNTVQKYYDDTSTIKPLNNGSGSTTTTVSLTGRKAKSILVIYTKSSSKKNWFSLKEMEVWGATESIPGHCPDGQRWDPIAQDCLPIHPPDDDSHVDINGVEFFEEDGITYLSENHTFHKNFRSDGSMRMDIQSADMGGKCRSDKEVVVFLKTQKTKAKERCNLKSDGGPHTPTNPPIGRCEDFGITFDGKEAVWEQELRHEGGGGGPYMERAVEDISKYNLPSIANNWYGFCWRDRRVLKSDDGKLLGRIMEIKVNPNPFDKNRNVINANWIDLTAFLDKGQFKDDKGKDFPIIDGPVDPEKYQDTIRVDGQDASTFLERYLRYCGIKPIEVASEAEMEDLYKKLKDPHSVEPPDEEAPVAKITPPVINVTEDKQEVVLDASESTGKDLKYLWKQMSGTPIELSQFSLASPTITLAWKKEWTTSEFSVTVTNEKGKTSSAIAKVVNAINVNPEDKKYIDPQYPPDIASQNLYFRMKDYVKGIPNLGDGRRVDVEAKKWDLSVKSDGSVYYNAKTGRLKIWGISWLDIKDLYKVVESQNKNWDYEKARELRRWGRQGFCNVECTAILTFDKQQSRKDAFVGWVVRSCIHDLKTDPESKGRPNIYRAGSSYHSNIQVNGNFEEKCEGGHAIYSNAKKVVTHMTNIPDLAGKKVGWKFCLQNTMFEGKPVVLSQTYLTLHPDDTDPNYAPWWATIYTGDEFKDQVQSGTKDEKKLDQDPGLITWESDYIILKANDSKMTFHDIEIKPITPIPEISQI